MCCLIGLLLCPAGLLGPKRVGYWIGVIVVVRSIRRRRSIKTPMNDGASSRTSSCQSVIVSCCGYKERSSSGGGGDRCS